MRWLHFIDTEGRDLAIPSTGLLSMRAHGDVTQLVTTAGGYAVQCPIKEHIVQLESEFGVMLNMKPE